jgi:hypothetical protein
MKHERRYPKPPRGPAAAIVVFLQTLTGAGAQEPLAPPGVADRYAQLASLPAAGQSGPSCAFFANVPALTMATGINVADGSPAARRFITGAYGLRRGDFAFERSFDRKVFFALFGLPSDETTIYHPEGDRKSLLPAAAHLLETTLAGALDAGNPVSIRVVGAFGGNHNVLLLGRDGNRFLCHDPFPGRITSVGIGDIATRILTRSSLPEHQEKEVYFSSYHIISTGSPGWRKPLTYSMLPGDLAPIIDAGLVRRLGEALRPAPPPATATPAELEAVYPGLRFAFIRKERKSGPVPGHAISQDLAGEKLVGLLHLSRFHLNAFHLKTRPLIPVLFLDRQPLAFVGYRASTKDDPTNVILHDGRRIVRHSFGEVLPRLAPLLAFIDTFAKEQSP